MVVYDALHNVWLGTCKRIMHHIFIERKMLEKDDLEYMAAMISNLVLPCGYDCASIARKILVGDGFGYFKADEWRIFALHLSPLVLKGRLPRRRKVPGICTGYTWQTVHFFARYQIIIPSIF